MENNLPEQIRTLVSEDNLEEAIALLSQSSLANKAHLLSARLKGLRKSISTGTIREAEQDFQMNSLRGDILKAAGELESPGRVIKNHIIATSLVVIISLGIGVFALVERLNSKEENTSIFTNDEAYHILLLPFGPDGNCLKESNQYHWQVHRRLNELIEKDILDIEVQRKDSIMCDLINVDSVKNYGEKLGADLVIYGNYQEQCEWDTTLLNIRFVRLDSILANSFTFNRGEKEYAIPKTKSLAELRNGNLTGTIEDVLYFVLGMGEYSRKSFERSIQLLKKVSIPESRKEFAIVPFKMGDSFLNLGQFEEAIKSYNKAIVSNPKFAYAYNNRGIAFYNLNQSELAFDDFNKALNLNSTFKRAYKNRASIYDDLGKYDLALEDYHNAIKIDSKYVDAYHNLGVTYLFMKEYDSALMNFNKALGLDSEKYTCYNGIGLIHFERRQYDSALINFNKVISFIPKFALAYNNRGLTYFHTNKTDSALMDYDKAIQLKHDFPQVYNNKGLIYRGKNEYDSALIYYEKAIELNPEFYNAYENRGTLKFVLKEYEFALSDYKKAISLKPNIGEPYYSCGNLYLTISKYDSASIYYTKAIELIEDYKSDYKSYAYTGRGRSYMALKKYEFALGDFQRAISLNPVFFAAYYSRADAYRHLDELEKAKKDIEKALSMNSNSSMSYAILAMINAQEGDIEGFYSNLEKSILMPKPYVLEKGLKDEEILQRFKDSPRFQALLEISKKKNHD